MPDRPPPPSDTDLQSLGRAGDRYHGFVNVPIFRGSTVTFRTVAEMKAAPFADPAAEAYAYGLLGNPNTRALESTVAALDRCHGAVAVGSGLAACTIPLLAYLSAGDHLLMVDSCYGPTRFFCDKFLSRMGVATTFYDPGIGAAIEGLFRPNTRVAFLETPGSLTFEMQDVPAIAAACRARGVVTMIDNTWATPMLFRPAEHGVDVTIHAATKYLSGHSDLLAGVVSCREESTWRRVREMTDLLGPGVNPEDCFLVQRGIRSLGVRLGRHGESALEIARWLRGRSEVSDVLFPPLEGDPGHSIWKRDFDGAAGLLGITLHPRGPGRLEAFLEGLELFRLGYSWGGFESLVVASEPWTWRTSPLRPTLAARHPLVRLQVGLEDPRDLVADLERGLARYVVG
jgi:cystathionine beta-lyase